MKLSFKKGTKLTGLKAVGYPYPSTEIKIDGKFVGYIRAPNWQTEDNLWSVSFTIYKTVPDSNPNCNWKWITVKKKFEEEPDARKWIKENIEALSKMYPLRLEEK